MIFFSSRKCYEKSPEILHPLISSKNYFALDLPDICRIIGGLVKVGDDGCRIFPDVNKYRSNLMMRQYLRLISPRVRFLCLSFNGQ